MADIHSTSVSTIEYHEVANLFPLIEGDEFEALKQDIALNGQRERIWTYQGKIIDGRNRHRACVALGLLPLCQEWDGKGSLVAFSLSMNLKRRHLTSSQLAMVAADALPLFEEENRKKQIEAAAKGGQASGETRRGEAKVSQKVDNPSLPQRSAEQAAKTTGTNRQYVSEAKKVIEKAPELAAKVRTGEITIKQATAEVKRIEKRETLQAKAAEAKEQPQAEKRWQVIVGDAVAELRRMTDRPRLIFADPPYNIGIDYGEGEQADALPGDEFPEWLEAWIRLCKGVLADDGSLWVLISDEYAAECCVILKRYYTLRNWLIWYETFGVNCSGKFNRTKRHLFYCVKDSRRFVFNGDAVTRPSARQVLYNDGRAAEGGKLWDDVWAIPRLPGTADERIPDFPTQLPLALLRPIIECASDPGDLVVDPFNGSGTTGVAALQCSRRYLGIEKSVKFAELATLRLKGIHHGDAS